MKTEVIKTELTECGFKGINTMAVWKCKPTADFPYFIYQSTCASVHCEQLDWLFIWNAKCYFVLPYVSSVIFLTLYSVCMFLLPNWHLEVIMNCRMCQIFCSFVFWLHHGSINASQCWRQSFIHDFFPRNPFCSSNWTLLDHQQQLRKRANNFCDFDWLRNCNGIWNNCGVYHETEQEI